MSVLRIESPASYGLYKRSWLCDRHRHQCVRRGNMKNKFNAVGYGARLAAATAMAIAMTAATDASAEDTIKIGALLIDSGPLAGLKESQAKAINLAIEQINASGGADGRKLEADFITYPGTPDTAVDG